MQEMCERVNGGRFCVHVVPCGMTILNWRRLTLNIYWS